MSLLIWKIWYRWQRHIRCINSFTRSLLSPVHSSYIAVTPSCIWYVTVIHNVFTEYIYIMYIRYISIHDDVIKWKHFPRNWPFVRKIHRSPVNFPHKGQWRGALMFSLIYAWINDWANNREAGDLRRQHGHYDVIVMKHSQLLIWFRKTELNLCILFGLVLRVVHTLFLLYFNVNTLDTSTVYWCIIWHQNEKASWNKFYI